jgi:hypothetical protein
MEKLAPMLSDAPLHGDETIGHLSSVTYKPWGSASVYDEQPVGLVLTSTTRQSLLHS